jgi:hypothetical protein
VNLKQLGDSQPAVYQQDSRRVGGNNAWQKPRNLILLAPSGAPATESFQDVQTAPSVYQEMLSGMQKLRGAVYLADGAIRPEHLVDGRHLLEIDAESWHLLVVDSDNRVFGCMRYREYSNRVPFADLGVSGSALADSQEWRHKLRKSVESEIAIARNLDVPFFEIGGWALHEQIRGTTEALRMALASYSLVRLLGGGVAISTVTRRNGSASILSRLGGRSLEYEQSKVPAYYDPRYDCEMEVLKFYSWAPNPRYEVWVEELKQEIRSTSVLTAVTSSERAGWYRRDVRRTSAGLRKRLPLDAMSKLAFDEH